MTPEPDFSQPPTPRRRFLKAAIAWLSGAVGVVLAWPLVASLVGPAYRRAQPRYIKAIAMDQLPQGRPTRVSFPYASEEAYIHLQQARDVWVIKHSATQVTVFSPICTHLSCRYDWNAQSEHFLCPCHGSVFSITGAVLAGPAPRPLDALPYRIEDGVLLVQWEVFESGVPGKVRV